VYFFISSKEKNLARFNSGAAPVSSFISHEADEGQKD